MLRKARLKYMKYTKNQSDQATDVIEPSDSDVEIETFTKQFMSASSGHGHDDVTQTYRISDFANDSDSENESATKRLKRTDDCRTVSKDSRLSDKADRRAHSKKNKKAGENLHLETKPLKKKKGKTLPVVMLPDDSANSEESEVESMVIGEKLNDHDHDNGPAESSCVPQYDLTNLEDTDADYKAIRNELSSMPIADLLQLKEKLGAKMYDEIMYGGHKRKASQPTTKKKFTRENKNRPVEMSSKKPAPYGRSTSKHQQQFVARDPRFDDLSGELNEMYFKQSYGFLSDVKLREKQKLVKTLKKTKDEERSLKLQQLLTRMTQQEKAEKDRDSKLARQRALKKKEKQLVAHGKRPFFLKKSEKKKIELAEKFQKLESSGKLEQYIAKKKKKNLKAEKKHIPFLKTTNEEPCTFLCII